MSNSLMTPIADSHLGGDQARGLRERVSQHSASNGAIAKSSRGCHTIVVAGGKGGVGRSVVALNLSVLLSLRGDRVGLIDACPDLGHINLLCGLRGYWNLSHVVQGCRSLNEVVQTGPGGVKILSGGSCLSDLVEPSHESPNSVLTSLQAFERELDWLIIDASGTDSDSTDQFAAAADDVLIVTTPEATAVAEAYAAVKSFASNSRSRLGLMVNQATSAAQAQQILDRLQQATHSFLHVDLHRRGFVPQDTVVPRSVSEQVPFCLSQPESAASEALRKLAQRWTRFSSSNESAGFFGRMLSCRSAASQRRAA